MTFAQECFTAAVGLMVLCLALLFSVCLNVILWIRKGPSCRDRYDSCCHQVTEEEIISQSGGHYFHQETSPTHHEQQENPIYGNISTQTGACYETMTAHRTRDCMKQSASDLNYASLDLKMAKKQKKQRIKLHDQSAVRLTPPVNSFLDANVDAGIPFRDTSTMASHSSIYLNSQQIALETEEMERDQSINMELRNTGWDGVAGHEDDPGHDGDQVCRDRRAEAGGDDEDVCTAPSNGEDLQSSTGQFIHIFSGGDEGD